MPTKAGNEAEVVVFVARTYAEVPVVLGNRREELGTTSFSYQPMTFYKYLKYAVMAFVRWRPANLKRES